jgi:hypothetical protein
VKRKKEKGKRKKDRGKGNGEKGKRRGSLNRPAAARLFLYPGALRPREGRKKPASLLMCGDRSGNLRVCDRRRA